ncbi:MAG: HAMP domain-containing histidine kinase [Candidatus Solibacter usitatus]|nr:HAMP domain-containing histidine kinase [Candidatus Solibacter usitatus]
MPLARLRQFLHPDAPEKDELFVQEILRSSHLGLQVIAAIEMVAPAFLFLEETLLTSGGSVLPMLPLPETVALIAVGAASWFAARADRCYDRCRALAWISSWLAAAVLVCGALRNAAQYPGSDHMIPGRLALVLLVTVALVPLRPAHTLALGVSLGAVFWIASFAAMQSGALPGIDSLDHAVLFTLTLLGTMLTAVIYAQRWGNFQSYMQALQASQDLRVAQSQGLQSENAAQMGKLAAAISHELNTPLGALKSGVQTLVVLAAKQATAGESGQQERFVKLQADCLRSIKDSATRIEQMVGRLRRFTHLDRAELQPANLNVLLEDAAALLEPELKARVKLEFEFETLPEILCRPQQLSGVFANLLGNAAGASEQDGVVAISTRKRTSGLEIVICDRGRGIAAEDVKKAFDPGFKVSAGRMASGNWSLFHARQVVREQGGEIQIQSEQGKGTTVSVVLPC